MSDDESVCPGCAAPRAPGPECPRCGIIYAKAGARVRRSSEVEPVPPASFDDVPVAGVIRAEAPAWEGDAEDAATERRIRQFAIPAALGFAWLLAATGMGRSLARIVFTMPLHELGHAISAWLCGVPAFPTLWFTRIGEERSFIVGLLVFGAIGFWGVTAARGRRFVEVASASVLAICALIGTLGLSLSTARAAITFGGDAGALILGALCISTMNAREESRLRRGWTRWGLLVIGAFAIADVGHEWFAARADPANIAFGVIEGTGLSDPSKLVDEHGWSEQALVSRYVALALLTLLAIGLVYAEGLRRLRVDEKEQP